MWNEYAKNPENALEWQTQYLRFMFDLEDASGDGSIDVDEFISVCSCYGLEPSECKEAFQKMSCVSVSTIRCRLNVPIYRVIFRARKKSTTNNSWHFGSSSSPQRIHLTRETLFLGKLNFNLSK
jgi:hypothetical protein